MAKELAAWKQEYLDGLRKMTNTELLLTAFEAAAPDDYDGGFSTRGAWMADVSRLELYERLWSLGVIEEKAVQDLKDFIGAI